MLEGGRASGVGDVGVGEPPISLVGTGNEGGGNKIVERKSLGRPDDLNDVDFSQEAMSICLYKDKVCRIL